MISSQLWGESNFLGFSVKLPARFEAVWPPLGLAVPILKCLVMAHLNGIEQLRICSP